MAKDRITIWGTSFKKIADEAQLLAHYKIITSHDPDQKITFITKPRTEISKNYPQIKITPFSRPLAAIRALTSSRLLVISGGPFFDDPPQLLKTGILISLAKLLRIPILVYGVTVFPIQTWWGKIGYRKLLSQVNTIYVRDRVAFECLINIGLDPGSVKVGTDPRNLLDPAQPARIREILRGEGIDPERPIIAISTRHFDSHMPAWVKNTHGYDDGLASRAGTVIARSLNHLSNLGQLVLIPMHPDMEEDLQTAAAIRNQLDDPKKLIVLGRRFSLAETLGIIAASDLFITARVGSVLFASITSTPVLAIAYDQRTVELMEELGMQDFVFGWRLLDEQRFYDAALFLLQNRKKIGDLLKLKSSKLREKAVADSLHYHDLLNTAR